MSKCFRLPSAFWRKFFPFRIDSISEEFDVQKSKQEVKNIVSLGESVAENLPP